MTRADISDVIHLFVDEAGLSDEEFFMEGISGECRVGPPDYDFVTVTPNLSPAAYYTDNVFEPEARAITRGFTGPTAPTRSPC